MPTSSDGSPAGVAACAASADARFYKFEAADGSVVEIKLVEWSNTHWVRTPRLTDNMTGNVLLDLWDTDWDASVTFPTARTVRLDMRRYHFGGGATVEIDLDRGRYVLFGREGEVSGQLAEVVRALEAEARRYAASMPVRPSMPPVRPDALNWLVALLMLIGSLLLIGLPTIASMYLDTKASKPALDIVPQLRGK